MSDLIGKLGQDKTKSVQVNIEEYKGITGVDIREWYMSGNDWRPTSKGIRVQLDTISGLITLLEQAEARLVSTGHITIGATK